MVFSPVEIIGMQGKGFFANEPEVSMFFIKRLTKNIVRKDVNLELVRKNFNTKYTPSMIYQIDIN